MSTPQDSSCGSSSKPPGPSPPPPLSDDYYSYDYQEDSQYQYGGPQHYHERGGNTYNKRLGKRYHSERPNLSQLRRSCVVVGDEEFMYVNDQDEASAIIEALRVKGGGEAVFLVVTYDPQTKIENPENWQWVLDMTRGKKWINDEVGQKWICVVVGKPKRRIVSDAPDVRYCKNKLIKIQNKPIFKVRGKREAQLVLRAALETGEVVGLSMDYDHTIQQHKTQNWQWFVNEVAGKMWINDVMHKKWTCLISSDTWTVNSNDNYLKYVRPDIQCCVKALIQVGTNAPVACGDYLDALPLINEGKAAGQRVTLIFYGKKGWKDETATFRWVIETAGDRQWRRVIDDLVWTCVLSQKGYKNRSALYTKKTKAQKQKEKNIKIISKVNRKMKKENLQCGDDGTPNLSYFRYCFIKVGDKPSTHIKHQTEARMMIQSAKEEGLDVMLIVYLDNEVQQEDAKEWGWVLSVSSGRPWQQHTDNKDKWTNVINQCGEVTPTEDTVYEKGTPDLQYCINCVVHVGTRRPYSVYNAIQVRSIVRDEEKSGEKVTLVLTFRDNFKRKDTSHWDWIDDAAGGRPWYKIQEDMLWICVLAEKRVKKTKAKSTTKKSAAAGDATKATTGEGKEEEIDGFCKLPSYPCEVCKEDFDDIPALQAHLESSEHQQLSNLYDVKLDYARKLLTTNSELKTHQLSAARSMKFEPGTNVTIGMKNLVLQLEETAAQGGVINKRDLELHATDKLKQFHNRMVNNFLRCFLCNQFFLSSGKMIQHKSWLPHMERAQMAERFHEVSCKELYPSLTPVNIGPGREVEEELLDMNTFGLHHSQGFPERREAYDPGRPDVSESGDIDMDLMYKCSICVIKFNSALDAFQHCRSEIHQAKYLEYLQMPPEQRAEELKKMAKMEDQSSQSYESDNDENQGSSAMSQKRKAGSDDDDEDEEEEEEEETVEEDAEGMRKIAKLAGIDKLIEDVESTDVNEEGS